MPPPLPTVVCVLSLSGMGLIWRDISSMMKGKNRPVSSLLCQYAAVKAVGWLGRRQRRKLEADTLKVKQVQEETLLKRLRKNAETCYGRQYEFSSIEGNERTCGRVLLLMKECCNDVTKWYLGFRFYFLLTQASAGTDCQLFKRTRQTPFSLSEVLSETNLFLLNVSDAADFRARHPLTSYEHYAELIRRVAAGEEKVIIAEKPLILAMTSGTSGSSSMLLSTKDTNAEFFLQVRQTLMIDFMCSAGQHEEQVFFPSGRGCLFRCHATGFPWDGQPSAHRQILLQSHVSPIRSRNPHRAELFHASFVPPHAQPLHDSSSGLWGPLNKSSKLFTSLFVYMYFYLKALCSLRFPARRTPCTCTSCLLSKIQVWEHWSPTLLLRFSTLSQPYRCLNVKRNIMQGYFC